MHIDFVRVCLKVTQDEFTGVCFCVFTDRIPVYLKK